MKVDTVYALQDKKDDVKAGIGSTALLFGSSAKLILSLFGVVHFACLVVAGILEGASGVYYVVSVGVGAAWLFGELAGLDVDDPKACWRVVSPD